MKLAFNELSFRPHRDNQQQLWDTFNVLLGIYKNVNEEFGFTHILFPIGLSTMNVLSNMTFYEWVNSLDRGKKEKILSQIRKPFSPSILEDDEDHIVAYFYSEQEVGIEEEECIGLSVAAILDIPSISLQTHSHWETTPLYCFRLSEDAGVDAEQIEVENLCTQSLSESLAEMVDRIRVVELQESKLTYKSKTIHLRHDHGQDILLEFSRKILNSPFVENIVNSLPFNSETRRFVRRCYPNGIVEIVLFWTDEGYGLVVQTTGRNLKETIAIAKELEEKFSK